MKTYRRLPNQLMKTMFLLTLTFMIAIVDVQSQAVVCSDDFHCSAGFFCHTLTNSCHECLSCEHLKRHPGPIEKDCIKSDKQCGPCFQGLINDEANWGAICFSPEAKPTKILTTYITILVICVASGVLISLIIIHGIWNTHIIKVNIAMPSCQKTSKPSYLNGFEKCQIGLTAV